MSRSIRRIMCSEPIDLRRWLGVVLLASLVVALAFPQRIYAQESSGSAPRQPAGGDYSRLADPAVASGLGLADGQRDQIAEILRQRDAALAEAAEDQRSAIIEDADARLRTVLSDEQRALFAALYLKRLQFNFQYQKWADVLEWIAEESGLSLVMDAPPAGTFNYSDTREYSPTEAIDLLNGWLQTKNYALVRRDRLLMLLDLTDGVPVGVIPRVPVEELPSRGRFELVSVLVPLGERPAQAAVAEITPLLGRHGAVEPLPQTKQLLVTDTAGNLLAVRAIVEALPVPSAPPAPQKPPDPVLTVYPLRHANPSKVGDVLNEMIAGQVVVDEAASQVTVNAVPADQERARIIIRQMEENQGPEKQPRLETYPAPRTGAQEVIATLQLVAPGAQVRLNSTGQQLQVWATPQDQQTIRETLAQLGAAPADGGPPSQLQVYPVARVAPQAAMTALTTVLPGLRVTVDSAGGSLIVVGSLAEHQAVARLIEQLENPDDPRLEKRVEVYPLTRADSGVTSLLSTLAPNAQVSVDSQGMRLIVVATGADHERIADILRQVGDDDVSLKRSVASYPLDRQLDLPTVTSLLATLVPQAQVTPDATHHRLLIVATPSEHEAAASAIEQAARDAGVELPQLEFHRLENVDGSKAVSILQPLAPAAQMTFDAQAKRLTVIARPEEQQTIRDTLARLEAVSKKPEERVLKVYDVTPVQKSRFASLAAGLSSELTRMQVLSDSEPGELAIWATPSEHAAVENVLQQLTRDLPDELTPRLVSYPLLKTDAATLSTVLAPLFPNVRINVDAKANRLLIWARPAEHDALRQALQQLDTDAPVESEFKLMAYPVDALTPEVAAQMIQSEVPGVTVITDQASRTLIIRARGREHERIAALLEAVNESRLGVRERSVVVYPAIPGDPSEVYNFFARSIPSASVLVDRATGRMSVWATAAEHEQIRHAVADMIGTGDGDLKALLKTYRVDNAPPGTVATLVSQVAPTAKLAVSADGRHLSVWARSSDHTLIQGVVDGLAAGPDGGEERAVTVFNVKPIGTAAARSLLTPIVPQVTFAEAPDGGALLAWVSEADRARIQAALDQVLSDKTLSGERELRIYDLADAGGSQAQQVLAATMPSISFTSTDGGRTVVAWARRQDHERIAATIAELDESGAFKDDRLPQVYSIRDLGPNVLGIVSALVPGVQAAAGPRSDEIIVTGRPKDQQKVSELIERLRSESRPRLRTIVSYDIGRADPEAVRQIVQPLTDADSQFTVDARGRRLFVRTYTDKLAEIEAAVKGIIEPHPGDESLTTRTYHLDPGEADEAQEVLQAMLPGATLVTDSDRRVLAATATADQHELIRSVVEDMRGAFGSDGTSQPVTYPLRTADPDSTLQTLRNLFARSPEVSLSVDRPTRTLVAIARPDQQETIRTLVEQLDRTDDAGNQRTVQVYPMRGTDSGTAVTIVRTLLENIDPDASVAYNPQTRQIVVTTREDGHARLREMTDALGAPGEWDVEVFQLERMEPFTARLAIDGLFNDGRTDPADRPSIQTNEDTQQLIVRGLPAQIEQIREVLVKMGEAALSSSTGRDRNVRIIPIDGDLERALPRIEQLWPRLRTNPLRILRPGGQGNGGVRPLPLPREDEPEPLSLHDEGPERVGVTELVAYAPSEAARLSGADEGEVPPVTSDAAAEADAEVPTDGPPPVVIIPGTDRVTIASEDVEALNQLELLLRSLFSRRDAVRGRDFTVYALQNAGAATVAETLNEFFRRNSPVSSGNVMVVPDYRLNALIVYAGPSDRDRIEDLIQTLDSENIPDSLAAFQTRIVPVQYADAGEIARTLQGIYKAQMTAGGARQSVSIPEGVPSSIASVLRQINAAASSPLLTVEVDRATNSLVLMAPHNLLDEVAQLVDRLDQAAAVSRARELRIIPLRKSRSARVMELLQKITDQR